MIMPGIPGSSPDLNVYPFDLASAQQHMTQALQELGVSSPADLGKLSFGFNAGAGHEPRVAFLAEAWSQAFPGLQFDQIGVDFPTFLTSRHAGEYIISRNGWNADYPHANNQLNGLFTCGGGNNDQQWCNAEFDKLLADAAVETDPAAQVGLYEQAQKILADDAASLFLRWGVQAILQKPYVGNVTNTPMDSQVPGEHFYETIQMLPR
jgi:ABC-type oligopeptide transport system substrate-binding subunit